MVDESGELLEDAVGWVLIIEGGRIFGDYPLIFGPVLKYVSKEL